MAGYGKTALVVMVALAPVSALAQGWQPQLVSAEESGFRNVPNFRFDRGHTAQGLFQITDTNWRHYAPLLDIDTNKYPNAGSAPADVQNQVGFRMWYDNGYQPWTCCNDKLRRDLQAPHGSARVRVVRGTTHASSPNATPEPTSPHARIGFLEDGDQETFNLISHGKDDKE